jgi:hypothetical protein
VSGGQGRGGVEELREVVGAQVPALEVGDRGGIGDAAPERPAPPSGPRGSRSWVGMSRSW